jgi:di/tricarboxylate transporter
MILQQASLVAILLATVAMFVWGRWRHDMVSLAALLGCVLAGLVPASGAFAGFGHPAVITVACVLVLSHGLQSSGAVDTLIRRALPLVSGAMLTVALLTLLAAVLSAFMNNVGALALMMPVALQVASRHQMPAGRVLMPVAFGSILGGMTTMIGTPPNLIVSGFRAETGAGSFSMFDFSPVGLAVAAAGVLFVALLGRWLVPARERAGTETFDTADYLTEARVPEGAKALGQTLGEIEAALEQADAQVVGLVRNEVRVTAPRSDRVLREGDILLIQAEAQALATALSSLGLVLEEARPAEKGNGAESPDRDVGGDSDHDKAKDRAVGRKPAEREHPELVELAVLPNSSLVGRSATDLLLRTRYGINLLAVSREGRRSMSRLRTMRLAAGDVLLLQGSPEALAEFASDGGCVPLAARSLRIPDRRKALLSVAIMLLAVGGAAFGLLPAAISFAAGVLASMALRTVPLRAVYEAIDWPVIVLLGALIPVAGAIETTGTAELLARWLIEVVSQGHAVAALVVILVVTMTLSDLMNNAATAAVMCPIAIGAASQLGVSADPFLMAVAVGASCAFLTPIGHQNNTLILGPGGFHFGDYWRLGLPLELLVIAISVPMLLWVWPM